MVGAQLCTSVCDGFVVAALRGDLDIANTRDVAAALACLAGRGGCVIVDVSALDFIDCGALAALLGVRQLARAGGGDVVLAGPRGCVARILDLTELGEVFGVYASVPEAVDGNSGDAGQPARVGAGGTRPGRAASLRAGCG